MKDREMRLRVYKDGRIVVSIFAPATLGERMISTHIYNNTTDMGWFYILKLIDRVQREWLGLDYVIKVRYQGMLPPEGEGYDDEG